MENKHDKGQALTILAHKLARAVYDMVKRKGAFDMKRCLHDEGRGVGELDVQLDNHGMNLILATLSNASLTASLNAYARIGHYP